MGQKRRAKRATAPKRIVTVSTQPSLVKSSATFQPKTVQFEEALSVRRADIQKIGLLGAIMFALLVALTVISVTTPLLQKAGTRLAQITRL